MFSLISTSLRFGPFDIWLREWGNVIAHCRLGLERRFRVNPTSRNLIARLQRTVNLCIVNDIFLICGKANDDVLMVRHR
jgi:hypothetical protein